jgi:hypothetical protein
VVNVKNIYARHLSESNVSTALTFTKLQNGSHLQTEYIPARTANVINLVHNKKIVNSMLLSHYFQCISLQNTPLIFIPFERKKMSFPPFFRPVLKKENETVLYYRQL